MRVLRSSSFPPFLSNACLRLASPLPGEAPVPHPGVSPLLLGGTDSPSNALPLPQGRVGGRVSSWLRSTWPRREARFR